MAPIDCAQYGWKFSLLCFPPNLQIPLETGQQGYSSHTLPPPWQRNCLEAQLYTEIMLHPYSTTQREGKKLPNTLRVVNLTLKIRMGLKIGYF